MTAAQSFFAVTLLVNFEISVREAVTLLGLFVLQFLPFFQDFQGLVLFSGLYLVLGIALLVRCRDEIPTVVARAREHAKGSLADVHS